MGESLNNLFHGHLSCVGGVHEASLLAACVDAAAIIRREEPTSVIHMVGKIANKFLCAEWDFEVEKDVGMLNVKVACQSRQYERLPAEKLFDTNQIEAHNSEFIPPWVKTKIKEVMSEIRKAEMKVNWPSDETSVPHESMFHMVAVLLCLDYLGVKEISCDPVPICNAIDIDETSNNSFTRATMLREILVDMPVKPVQTPVSSTPLGLALLRVLTGTSLAPQPPQTPSFTLRGTGSGRGSTSSLVFLMVGENTTEQSPPSLPHETIELATELWDKDVVTLMESNMDDITGENLAYAVELLLQEGAMDSWMTPIVMKKGRPAHTLHCLCKPSQEAKLLDLIFRNTTTLGVRTFRNIPRAKLFRSFETAVTSYKGTKREGLVHVKLSKFKNGEILTMKAEFDHCKEIAKEMGVPVQAVAESALSDIRTRLN